MKGVITVEIEEEAATADLREKAAAGECSAMTYWTRPDRHEGASSKTDTAPWKSSGATPSASPRHARDRICNTRNVLWTASNTEAPPSSYLHVRPRSWGQESKLETNGPSRVGLFSHLLRLLFPEADLVVRLVMPALPERLGSGVLQLWTLGWRITLKTVGKR